MLISPTFPEFCVIGNKQCRQGNFVPKLALGMKIITLVTLPELGFPYIWPFPRREGRVY